MSATIVPAYEVNLERWPLVSARATAAVHDDKVALDATYRALEAVLARRHPFVALLDMRGGVSSSSRRRRFVNWAREHASSISTYMVAMAVVARSEVERGVVTAAFWVMDNPYGVRVFADRQEAEDWLLGAYERRAAAPRARSCPPSG